MDFIAQLTGFDLDENYDSLRITFNIAKGDIKELLKSRVIKLGDHFEISDMTEDIKEEEEEEEEDKNLENTVLMCQKCYCVNDPSRYICSACGAKL